MDEYIEFTDADNFDQYFINVTKLADDIDGDFFECGFGWGHTSTLYVKNIIEKTIRSRHVCVADSFKGLP